MRRPFIAGNWKMHKTIREAVDFAQHLVEACGRSTERGIVLAPPFTALSAVAEALRGSAIRLAAQNLHDKSAGAYTGEVSATMLVDAGCEYVIAGHSERRALFGDTNDFVNRKLKAAISCGLRPIFCIGETLEERDKNKTFAVIEQQIKEGLNNLTADDITHIVIAYEPVWAIGSGRTATPEQAQEVHLYIREIIGKNYGARISGNSAIIYGGSVNPGNIGGLMAQPDVDGVLVGGASLDLEAFIRIIQF